jgi:hypothetical protein
VAELLPLLQVAGGVVERPLGDADGLRPDGRAAAVESVHGDIETPPLLPHEVLHRHPHVVEDDLARGTRPQPHLVLELGDLDTPVLLDDETADPPMPCRRVGLGKDGVEVRDAGVRDPILRPGDDVVVAVPHGTSRHGSHVGAGIGLRQAVAGLRLTGGDER